MKEIAPGSAVCDLVDLHDLLEGDGFPGILHELPEHITLAQGDLLPFPYHKGEFGLRLLLLLDIPLQLLYCST